VNISIETIIRLLQIAEKETSDFYSTVALNTVLKFPELSELFSDLAADELLHLKMLEMAQSYQQADENSFKSAANSRDQIRFFLDSLAEKKKAYLQYADRLTMTDIIQMAMEIEKSLVERHRDILLTTTNHGLRSLLENLYQADQDHLRRLTDFTK